MGKDEVVYMRKVLILGGSVFIGKAIANKFIKNGDEVYILNRGNHPCPEGAKQLVADRNNKEQFDEVVGENEFDIVVDGSAYNLEQTEIAIEKLNNDRLKHYIHISTATVYEEGQPQPYREDESKRGTAKSWGEYSTNKFLCEEKLFAAYKDEKLPITLIRPFYVYGPGNNLDRESYVFSRLIKGESIIVPGKGKCKVQFGHIDDLCDAIMEVSKSDNSIGEAYNVSGNEVVTFEEWIKTCGEVLQIIPKIILVDAQEIGYKSREWFPFRDIDMYGDISKVNRQLGVKPRYSLYQGLKETITHYTIDELEKGSNISKVEVEIISKIKRQEKNKQGSENER